MEQVNGKHILQANGRQIIAEPGEPKQVALPVNVARNALTPEEREILLRFTDASELAKGNYAVIGGEDQPRGRYERFAERISRETYAKHEIDAYRWILNRAFGRESMSVAELVVRMGGERTDITFEQLGCHLANTDDAAVGLGAAIGALRSLAWALKDAYRDYTEFWRARERAAQEKRALTELEALTRVRGGQASKILKG